MSKLLLLMALAGLFVACKGKKTSLAGEDAVDGQDFVEFFQPLKPPYQVTDTLLKRKEGETSVISYKVFTQLMPDTVITKLFGKEVKPRLYAIGKIGVPKAETYLFIKATTPARKALYTVVFNRKNVFAGSRPVLYQDNEGGASGSVLMDAKYTLTVTHQRKGADGQPVYKRDAYIFNEEMGFRLILTESNEVKTKVPPIYNPIDTLSHKHKFTGDYAQDKRNIISIRDGRDPSRILFFVHFEKDEGSCKGELKGEAKFISASTARFHGAGDPCTVDFNFGSSGVTMKEVEGCGNHRDIKCFFEGYFQRRAASRPKPSKKKE